nr:MAG TPA: hypothetical protein [Caudoviricetes sp.]
MIFWWRGHIIIVLASLWWLVALCIWLWSARMQRAFSYARISFLSCIAVSYNI